MTERPIPDSYWVEPRRFLAGEYPGARHEHDASAKLVRLRDVGIRTFIDLTEAGEHGLEPYDQHLSGWATHHRHSIPDLGVPSRERMVGILDAIDEHVAGRPAVYVHCWGGVGRTGTVVGCWLVRHGMTGDEALATIAAWREPTPDGHRRSPEMNSQEEMVLEWEAGE